MASPWPNSTCKYRSTARTIQSRLSTLLRKLTLHCIVYSFLLTSTLIVFGASRVSPRCESCRPSGNHVFPVQSSGLYATEQLQSSGTSCTYFSKKSSRMLEIAYPLMTAETKWSCITAICVALTMLVLKLPVEWVFTCGHVLNLTFTGLLRLACRTCKVDCCIRLACHTCKVPRTCVNRWSRM